MKNYPEEECKLLPVDAELDSLAVFMKLCLGR
jgi:hypothetical protein